MEQANGHRGDGPARRRSTSPGLSPYFIEDIGLTPGELRELRSVDMRIVSPR